MRKIVIIILAFIICCLPVTSSVYAENMTELQTKQEEIQNQINSKNDEIEDVQGEISETVILL